MGVFQILSLPHCLDLDPPLLATVDSLQLSRVCVCTCVRVSVKSELLYRYKSDKSGYKVFEKLYNETLLSLHLPRP